jgi:hypothetical protein
MISQYFDKKGLVNKPRNDNFLVLIKTCCRTKLLGIVKKKWFLIHIYENKQHTKRKLID